MVRPKSRLSWACLTGQWQDLSSFADNREAERTRLTFEWLFDILLAWSDDVDEGEKVDEFFVKVRLLPPHSLVLVLTLSSTST